MKQNTSLSVRYLKIIGVLLGSMAIFLLYGWTFDAVKSFRPNNFTPWFNYSLYLFLFYVFGPHLTILGFIWIFKGPFPQKIWLRDLLRFLTLCLATLIITLPAMSWVGWYSEAINQTSSIELPKDSTEGQALVSLDEKQKRELLDETSVTEKKPEHIPTYREMVLIEKLKPVVVEFINEFTIMWKFMKLKDPDKTSSKWITNYNKETQDNIDFVRKIRNQTDSKFDELYDVYFLAEKINYLKLRTNLFKAQNNIQPQELDCRFSGYYEDFQGSQMLVVKRGAKIFVYATACRWPTLTLGQLNVSGYPNDDDVITFDDSDIEIKFKNGVILLTHNGGVVGGAYARTGDLTKKGREIAHLVNLDSYKFTDEENKINREFYKNGVVKFYEAPYSVDHSTIWEETVEMFPELREELKK